jgi:hypothetical protein
VKEFLQLPPKTLSQLSERTERLKLAGTALERALQPSELTLKQRERDEQALEGVRRRNRREREAQEAAVSTALTLAELAELTVSNISDQRRTNAIILGLMALTLVATIALILLDLFLTAPPPIPPACGLDRQHPLYLRALVVDGDELEHA